ncbi:MAG: RNA polymerase sigma factor [Planctomycetota bacterium]
MDEDTNYIELVKQAQLGDRESLDKLAELARGRLYAYVYRIVLREHSAQDIVQESMLEMFKVFGDLERADRFWPWLRGIAYNKIRRHFGKERGRREVPMSGHREPSDKQKDWQAGLAKMVGDELKQVVLAAMGELKPRHRKVLAMRCYEEMEYSEIAELLGCSELGVRVLFYRAKRSLQRALSRRGFGKGFLITALVLFGKMTAPSEAAAAEISVTATTAKVGVVAGLVGIAGDKTVLLSLSAAGLLAVGGVVATSRPEKTVGALGEKTPESPNITGRVRRGAGTVEECWYYFPEGTGGPVMTRVIELDTEREQSHCARRENDRANYHFDKSRNTIYVNNHRMWRGDLAVRRLPTDSIKLTGFLSQVEGRSEEMEYVPAQGEGLLVIATRDGAGGRSRIVRHHHALYEEYFRCDWPTGIRMADSRDAMHKRGWTYFRVAGEINGERVSGVGRVPFVYAAAKDYSPWLRLKVGDREALLRDGRGRVTASYSGGSFFKGLSRPWMGLHTIDMVRRDAAEQRVWFETKYQGQDKAEVVLTCDEGTLTYTVDMEKDVVDKITFSTADGKQGHLSFSYLQDIDGAGDEFTEPQARRRYGSKRRKSPGIMWLFQLSD